MKTAWINIDMEKDIDIGNFICFLLLSCHMTMWQHQWTSFCWRFAQNSRHYYTISTKHNYWMVYDFIKWCYVIETELPSLAVVLTEIHHFHFFLMSCESNVKTVFPIKIRFIVWKALHIVNIYCILHIVV